MKISTFSLCSLLLLASAVSAQTAGDTPGRVDKCIKPGMVALTFDDGPGEFNDQLLALLKKKNVVATFFVLGNMIDKKPEQAASLKKVLDAGHQLASHTYTHSGIDNVSDEQVKAELTNTTETMFKHSGVRPHYMRAPRGECGPKCLKLVADLGYIVTHWNVDTNDWQYINDPPATATEKSMLEINDKIVAKSDPKVDSFIILEHEIHKFSVDFVAEKVIDAVQKKGYKFVTVEECVGKPAYKEGSTIPSSTGAASGTNPSIVPKSGAMAVLASAWTLTISAFLAFTLL